MIICTSYTLDSQYKSISIHPLALPTTTAAVACIDILCRPDAVVLSGRSSHRWEYTPMHGSQKCSLVHRPHSLLPPPASHPAHSRPAASLLSLSLSARLAKIRQKKGTPEATINGHRPVKGETSTLTPKKTPTVTHPRRPRHRRRRRGGEGNAIGMGMRGCPREGESATASPRRGGGGRGAADRGAGAVEVVGAGREMMGLMR